MYTIGLNRFICANVPRFGVRWHDGDGILVYIVNRSFLLVVQMQLFSKVLTSLHGIEPHMKQVTKELNIDRHLSSADGDVFNDEIEDDEDVSDIEHHLDDAGSYFDDADEEKEHHHVREDDLGSESSEIVSLHLS